MSNQYGQEFEYAGRDLEAMSFANNYHLWILQQFRPYLGARVAEVGAGIGDFTNLLLGVVDKLTAYEPSTKMFEELRRRLGSTEKVTLVKGRFGEGTLCSVDRLDTVIYVNVLEHVKDDLNEVAKMRAGLTAGGHALVFVPALSFLFSEFDRRIGHFRRYDKGSLRSLFANSGFTIVKCHYMDLVGTLPWYLTMVLLKRELSPSSVRTYDKLVVPISRRIESIVKPVIGKNLILVAQKQ